MATGWAPAGFAALTEEDFAALLAARAGDRAAGHRRERSAFPTRASPALAQARVGVEVMDTRAACRTFNILVAEDRRVVAALIIG